MTCEWSLRIIMTEGISELHFIPLINLVLSFMNSFLLQEMDDSMNYDEMILEAIKSIAAATSALVKAASAAQRELIDTGKVLYDANIVNELSNLIV
jgi:hexokinase